MWAFHGSDIREPNIDNLAAGGRSWSSSTFSRCALPTRASLMTGRYPLRYGLQTGVIVRPHVRPANREWLLPAALRKPATRLHRRQWHLGPRGHKVLAASAAGLITIRPAHWRELITSPPAATGSFVWYLIRNNNVVILRQAMPPRCSV